MDCHRHNVIIQDQEGENTMAVKKSINHEMQGYDAAPEDQEDIICIRNEQGELVEMEVADDVEDD